MRPSIFAVLVVLFVSAQAQAWVIKSDFESGTIGQKADGRKTDPNSSGSDYAFKTTVYSDSKARSGKQSAEAILPKGSNGWEDWGMFYKFPDAREGDEIWFRVWINFPKDFQYATKHGAKGLRMQSFSSSGDSRYLNVYPEGHRIHTENWVDLTAFYNNNNHNNSGEMESRPGLGGWEALEMYVKCSSLPGKAAFRIWRNGELWFEDTQTPTLMDSGGYINKISILTLYSSAVDSPVTQSVWIDDVIITNEQPNGTDSKGNPFIGVGDIVSVAPPDAPIIR